MDPLEQFWVFERLKASEKIDVGTGSVSCCVGSWKLIPIVLISSVLDICTLHIQIIYYCHYYVPILMNPDISGINRVRIFSRVYNDKIELYGRHNQIYNYLWHIWSKVVIGWSRCVCKGFCSSRHQLVGVWIWHTHEKIHLKTITSLPDKRFLMSPSVFIVTWVSGSSSKLQRSNHKRVKLSRPLNCQKRARSVSNIMGIVSGSIQNEALFFMTEKILTHQKKDQITFLRWNNRYRYAVISFSFTLYCWLQLTIACATLHRNTASHTASPFWLTT